MLPVSSKISEIEYSLPGKKLTFHNPDLEKYPLLKVAFDLLKERNYAGMVAYAIADEVAVSEFLDGNILIKDINSVVISAVEEFRGYKKPESIADIEIFISKIESGTVELIKKIKNT